MPVKFSKSQMEAWFNDDQDFADWYVESFMARFLPAQFHSVSAQGKREMVVNGRQWAKRCGFTSSEAQAHFITLMWKVGADFFRHPGFAQIANKRAKNDMTRIDAFYAVKPDFAADAIQNSDDRYWYPAEHGLLSGGAVDG